MNSRKFLATVAVQFGLANILTVMSSSTAGAATQSWSPTATTSSWSLATNWVSGTAPVNGDDVVLIATSTSTTTPNANISGLSINSLTVNANPGSTQAIFLANPITIGAGGVTNNAVSPGANLQFNAAVTLSANQTWSGSRAISAFGAVLGGAFQLTLGNSTQGITFHNNSPTWSGGIDSHFIAAFSGAGAFAAGTTVTPWGTGTITMTNQNIDGVTSSPSTLQMGGAFTSSSAPVTLANNIVLNDVSAGNYTIQSAGAVVTFDTTSSYQLTGNISGSTNQTVTYSNAVANSTARFILTGSNTYTASSNNIISTSATQKVEFYANNTAGSATGLGSVVVFNNSLLGGTGAIRPAGTAGLTVNSGGRVNAGYLTTMGTLVVDLSATSGAAIFSTGSTFTFDIDDIGSSDQISFLGGSAGTDVLLNNNAVTINQTGSWETGDYVLMTFDGSATYTGTLGTLTLIGDPLPGGWSASITNDINGFYLTVVPEPSVNAMLAAGAAVGFLRMFRRRRS